MISPSSSTFKVSVAFVVGSLVGAFSAVQVAPRIQTTSTRTVAAGDPTAPNVIRDPSRDDQGTGASDVPDAVEPTTAVDGAQFACAPGRNGGATDKGVSATKITLATTVVQSGIGAAFLGDVKYAMEAVRNKVNREGGICGRQLDIKYVDDGWDPNIGARDLRTFINGDVFAIPVGPSSEGLNVVIRNGDIGKAGIPVVGTDGMLIDQYRDPWVWSVAVATASSARIMAKDAARRGAKNFSIVFDKNYKFGVEAAAAYNAEVKRLTGRAIAGYNKDNNCVESFCGILAGASSYSNEINQFEPGDFVAMFLEPTTALTWMATPGAPRASGSNKVRFGIGGAQPLFTRDFATNCQTACDQMQVWTGYRPPIEGYEDDPAVRTYVADLRRTKPDADEYNAFAQGGYVGMLLFVEALKKVGPVLTRARLRAVLDSMSFQSGLTLQRALDWSPAPSHFAAATMQAFTIQYKGTFSGWRTGQTARDPNPALGTG